MDIFRKNLAPISELAWEQIEDEAKVGLKNLLTARKVIDIEGPKGWDFAGLPTGKMKIVEAPKDKEFCYGIRNILPVVEPRISFTLNLWELDNAARGSDAIDLDNLAAAVKRIAEFEEKAIYNGLKDAEITGLFSKETEAVTLPKDTAKWLTVIAEAVLKLKTDYIEGPYSLVLPPNAWKIVMNQSECYPLSAKIIDVIGGDILLSQYIDSAMLISTRGDDFKMVLGRDISIGYEHHTSKEVTLFLTESFTFKVNEPNAAVKLNIAK